MKISIKRIYLGALIALSMLSLYSCGAAACRQWTLWETVTCYPCFNSGRMFLEPDSTSDHLELELSRGQSGVRMYLNIYLLHIPPLEDNPSQARIQLIVDGEEPMTYYAYRLEGGQRLFLPYDLTQYLIELLLREESFILKVGGRSQITVIPDNFQISYQRLMEIPIEEVVDYTQMTSKLKF